MEILIIFVPEMNNKLKIERQKAIGYMLKNERKLKLMTQEDVARITCIDQDQLCKIEKGKRRIDLAELLEYSNALGYTLTELVFKIEGYMISKGLTSNKMKEEYHHWLCIYWEYYKKKRHHDMMPNEE